MKEQQKNKLIRLIEEYTAASEAYGYCQCNDNRIKFWKLMDRKRLKMLEYIDYIWEAK